VGDAGEPNCGYRQLMARKLDAADVEAIALRVVEMLGERPATPRLMSAAELSRRLGLARSTVLREG
jgi:DNA-binding MurR/RpiR family transcriptional regulator